jgi:hypothetical protein
MSGLMVGKDCRVCGRGGGSMCFGGYKKGLVANC